MKKEHGIKVQRILGVSIMLLAFPIVPDSYPWYVSVLLFDIGLIIMLATKWNKLKKQLGINTSSKFNK